MPLISRDALKEFMSRPLENYDWVKEATEADLDGYFNDILPNPRFKTRPYLHQKACFYLGIILDRFLFFLDMGTGKTKIMLDVLDYRIGAGDAKRALVLVPNIVTIEGWLRETEVHSDYLQPLGLYGSRSQRWEALDPERVADRHLVILNYAGLVSLACKPGQGKRQIDPEALQRLRETFDVLILDESQSIKNRSTITYKIVKELAKTARLRYALTGTPFGRDPQDLWSQFHAVDDGETLGRTLTIFRSAYFNEQRNFWGGFEFKLDRRKEGKLYRALKNRSIRYRADECLDLPKLVQKAINVEFPKAAEKYYQSVVAEVVKAKGNYREMENVFVKMRQIASGFMAVRDEDDERIEIEFPDNPKLDALMELVDELPEDRKMVVFHEFIHTGAIISKALKEAKVKHLRLYGGTKDKPKVLASFLDDPSQRILVVNSASGGTGLNLQVANYVVFFESPVSPIVRQQAERRCYRTGQTRTTFMYDLVMKDTLDGKILSYIREGEDLLKALIEGKEQLNVRRTADGPRSNRARRNRDS